VRVAVPDTPFCKAPPVPIEFLPCDAARPPASELIAATVAGYDETYTFRGEGPSATPADFSPPAGVYLVGMLDGAPACGGGVKALGEGIAEIKRMYVIPELRGRGIGRELLAALEDVARDLGHAVVRLDTAAHPPRLRRMYLAAGYREIADYNGNPYAAFWGEKPLARRRSNT
jgi:GNAT superfamily N-acetyltransferase